CGAAEIQRVARNASRWPDMNTQSREVRNHGRRAARHVLSWSGWRHIEERLTPRFRTIQVCPKDLRAALRQAGVRKTECTGQSAALIAHRGGSPPCST